jgi:hypothetical protein
LKPKPCASSSILQGLTSCAVLWITSKAVTLLKAVARQLGTAFYCRKWPLAGINTAYNATKFIANQI